MPRSPPQRRVARGASPEHPGRLCHQASPKALKSLDAVRRPSESYSAAIIGLAEMEPRLRRRTVFASGGGAEWPRNGFSNAGGPAGRARAARRRGRGVAVVKGLKCRFAGTFKRGACDTTSRGLDYSTSAVTPPIAVVPTPGQLFEKFAPPWNWITAAMSWVQPEGLFAPPAKLTVSVGK
jgi:hypothetical protein